jgi:hypothetical protein
MIDCPACNAFPEGWLLLATDGFRVLFLSDWEACCTEEDLEYQLWNWTPLIKPPENLHRFMALAHG